LLKCKSLPRGPQLRMHDHGRHVRNPQQMMQQTGVTKINFGGFDLAFAEVFEPRRESSR
jgi:hypothetical protein